MKNNQLVFILTCALLMFFPFFSYGQLPAIALTKEQWKEDLQFLAKQLPKKHKNAFHTVSRQDFNLAVTRLDSTIPFKNDHEILIGFMQLVAMIGDAHTDLRLPPKTFHPYPFSLYLFGNEFRVIRTTAEHQKAIGAKLVAIGGVPADQVYKKVITLVAHENDYWQKHIGTGFMNQAEILNSLEITPDLLSAEWTFQKRDEQFKITAKAIDFDEKPNWITSLREAPIYRLRPGELLWDSLLSESQTLYVNFKGYPKSKNFKEISKQIINDIKDFSPKKIVIDFRLNPGGDMLLVQHHLLPELKKFDEVKKGNLYVVIGRATQSAAVANAIDLKKEMNAILVGEPAGGRPKGYSENDEMTLPNSKLKVSYSTRFYIFLDSDVPALMPDKLIEPDWEIYPTGRDLILEWIILQPFK
jgi:hypothetical protein